MIILENENIRATIAPKGAELQSLFNKQTGMEYMWSGDAAYWGKHSPVLFPIVGGLKNDTYYFNDKAYTLPRHGFARDKIFTAAKISDTEAVFTITENEETLKVYPFAFTFSLTYQIHSNTITCTYKVFNSGNEELLFSVGAHPAFAVPLTNDTIYADYFLKFNVAETLQRFKLDNGLVTPVAELLPLVNNQLQLSHKLFYDDAVVLKNMQSHSITLGCNRHQHGINFSFDDFPFFGIWAAKDAPFVCLEPWCGIADSVATAQQLTHKERINILPVNQHWQRSWSVECF